MAEQEEKQWGIILAQFPALKRAFKHYDRQIRFFNSYEWEEGVTKEKLIKRRDVLFDLATNLGSQDLILLYYIKHLRGISAWTLLRRLQNLYQAETDLYNTFHVESPMEDVIKILPIAYKAGRRGKTEKKS